MPLPNHRRQQRRPAPPPAALVSLAVIVSEAEQWRSAQNGKPGRGALRDYWRAQDTKHGARPDYQLWRHTQCADSPPERRQDVTQLAVQALRAKDAEMSFAALVLVLGWLIEGERGDSGNRLKPVLQAEMKRHTHELVLWLGAVVMGDEPAGLLQKLSAIFSKIEPGWKLGRAVNLRFLVEEKSLPVAVSKLTRWLLIALRRLVSKSDPSDQSDLLKNTAAWQMTVWRLQHEAGAPNAVQVELLLDAAATLRCAGQMHEAVRLICLALHLLPERAPAPLVQRCRVAAWTLAEAGLAAPIGLGVSLDDLPFPGEPASSEKGQEATLLFQDDADLFQQRLKLEVTEDADWQRLRAAGVVLNHPLAALAWIGKKAQSYALKKQHDLLQAAARLATRNHSLVTLGRILAESPESAAQVMAYASNLRESQRRMPVLRDSECGHSMATCLSIAWGRLEADAIRDEEMIYMLHETLLDREVTVSRCLPTELRLLALRHLHGRRSPSPLVEAVAADPRLMQQLEHQRAVELWSLASEIRERQELANTVWVSVVMKGELSSGRYSWIVQSSAGRQMQQGRLRFGAAGEALDLKPLMQEIAQAVSQLGASAEFVLLAADAALSNQPWHQHLHTTVSFIPSWEWAFRALRDSEKPKDVVFEVLTPIESTATVAAPATGPLSQACLLLPGSESTDANTRWTVLGTAETRRSLSLGTHPVILSEAPLKRGDIKQDLTRLSLAQASRLVLVSERPLTASDRETFEPSMLSTDAKITLSARVKALSADSWRVSGLPW
ncbi:MAG: hypothetical protein ABL974_10870 [Prosthecobacter sp.]